jgi:hypothetical protein
MECRHYGNKNPLGSWGVTLHKMKCLGGSYFSNALLLGLYPTRNAPQNWRKPGKQGGGHYENEMPSLLLDEKICFIRLPPNTLPKFLAGHYD